MSTPTKFLFAKEVSRSRHEKKLHRNKSRNRLIFPCVGFNALRADKDCRVPN